MSLSQQEQEALLLLDLDFLHERAHSQPATGNKARAQTSLIVGHPVDPGSLSAGENVFKCIFPRH